MTRNQFENHAEDEGEALGDDLAKPLPREPEDEPALVVKTLEEQIAEGLIHPDEARRLLGMEPLHIREHEELAERAAQKPTEAFLKRRLKRTE